MADFERLGICPELIKAVENEAWLLPTPVQDEAIPLILGGGDVCVAAETGSGKTGAFVLPCLQLVHETLRDKATCYTSYSGDTSPTAARALDAECRFGVNDKDSVVTVDTTGLVAVSDVERWSGLRATGTVMRGRAMFEISIVSAGLVRVGWATPYSSFELGKDARSFGYGGTGKKSFNRIFTDYGAPFGDGDTIGCLVDRDQRTIQFSKNGTMFPVAFEIPSSLDSTPLKPAVCGKRFKVKLRSSPPFQFPVTGYSAVLPEPPRPAQPASGTTTSNERTPLCVIVEPTRDLARQTFDVITRYQGYLDNPKLRAELVVGGSGSDDKQQMARFRDDGVDIVVGTMTKLAYGIQRSFVNLSRLCYLVLDEADELISQDAQRHDLFTIKNSSQAQKVQTLFFSATLDSPHVRSAIDNLTVNATWINLKGKLGIPETVHFVCYMVDPHRDSLPCANAIRSPEILPPTDGVHPIVTNSSTVTDPERLSQRVKLWKPQIAIAIADTIGMDSCLIFCRTNVDCNQLESYLTQLGGGRQFRPGALGKENPYSCVVLGGMRSQEERQRNLQHFKDGEVRFLICTDVAARGIDIAGLPFLIMMSLPDDPYLFFHRVGRVGRQDKMGLAVSLVSDVPEKVWYHTCGDRGRNCTNRHLREDGGCCIWYNERAYMETIEAKLGTSIPQMHPRTFTVEGILDIHDLNVLSAVESEQEEWLQQHATSDTKSRNTQMPTTAARTTASKGSASTQVTIYGKPKVLDHVTHLAVQAVEIAPSLEMMQRLETQVQRSYVKLLYQGL